MLRPFLSPSVRAWQAIFVVLFLASVAANASAAIGDTLTPNGDFETDADGDNWPDGWATLKAGGTWGSENDNHFLRLSSTGPGEMVMLYQEIPIPADVQAIEMTWKQRVSDLKVGKQSWFDARILLEFLDAARNKVTPTPGAPTSRKDTDGWVEKKISFLIPTGAKTLKFMPCLFQVESGQFDLDDLVLQSVDPQPLREKAAMDLAARQAKLEADAKKRRDKAAARLAESGNLISNGNFETDKKQAGWPDDWGKLKVGGSYEVDAENHYLRMTSPKPGEMVMEYRTIDVPAGVEALELTWRQRVTGLKKGEAPHFDARIMLDWLGIDGKKVKPSPAPSYSQKDTDGWVEKRHTFLVPSDALTLVMMPCLFQVKAGTFDIDDLVLKPTSAEPLLAAAKLRAEEQAFKFVPREEPKRDKWPSMLHVVGNRLHDESGAEVWLQGVNAGGLETLPQDTQPIKSTVVAIEDWHANCIRLPMNEAFWYGKSPYQKDGGEGYRDIIDQIITLAANRGAYVAVDLHRFRAPKQEHADFWKDFAAKYKNHPAVLFDVFNEPHGISWDVWKNGGFVGTKEGTDESAFLSEEEKKKNQGFESVGMQGLVDAVRSTGAKNIVIAGGMSWCNDLSKITEGYALDDKGGNGIMYSWHTYHWHNDWEGKMLATSEKYPIFLGEVGADVTKFSFIPAAAQEDPYTWVPDMLGFIQKHKLNWTGWCFHPKSSPIMISDWKYTPTPFWGKFAKEALEGKQFELKRTR
ncbi:cellulase family glycosylhydrolase [Blastopirellula sp. JC732]|uniref:Cellulase family glycosylhydrolase n=1 Tax=Blastopirellula sediminis TaxID=2894196 RepID=A0A9X1SM14_9BACT|nr:glycoside hydrolase family 5 protein [Blastopirellula sediminis]MCC9605456.1 cellulase family glycosylhydrolase [Blastopirellula sediminis]MCC9631244.1 cellulase family glycosylhydrolase [Blastopirellula sediminis]